MSGPAHGLDFEQPIFDLEQQVKAIEASGALTWVEFAPTGGVSPRGFALDPSGAFCYVLIEMPGTLKTFRVDSGRLLPVGDALPLGGKAIGIAWLRRP